MANKRLLQLPVIAAPTTGTNFYLVDSNVSYQGNMSQIANLLVTQYGLNFNIIDGGNFLDKYFGVTQVDGGGFGDIFSSNIDGGSF